MKQLIFFFAICLSICNCSNKFSNTFIGSIFSEYITMVDKEVPNTYSSGTGYTKTVEKNDQNPVEMIITLNVDSNIVKSCNITFSFSDFQDSNQYYRQLLNYLNKDNWEYVNSISKYKRPNGGLYIKNDVYLGIFESTPLAIPICFSKNISLNNFYDSPGHASSEGYLELRDIVEVENLIPGFHCFAVMLIDFEGYVNRIYTFNNFQDITTFYSCGSGWDFPYPEILLNNIPGEKTGRYLLINDINNDGINEIISLTITRSTHCITIYGFDVIEHRFKKYLEADFFFNYESPFSPIKINESNGVFDISILEVTDKETYDLQWFNYYFDEERRMYYKK